MSFIDFGKWRLTSDLAISLVCRLGLQQSIARRKIEEDIVELVDEVESFVDTQLDAFRSSHAIEDEEALSAFLKKRDWTLEDLRLEAARNEGLALFAHERFGSGLEDVFLRCKPDLDQVIYSLLRVKDFGLAQELWIQISEGEITFSQAASQYGEGPEAKHAGQLGPLPLGNLYPPELRELLRKLRPGDLSEPKRFGDWIILVRLENLAPAVLDKPMRERLLNQELDTWLQQRSLDLLEGRDLDPLDYHSSHERNRNA